MSHERAERAWPIMQHLLNIGLWMAPGGGITLVGPCGCVVVHREDGTWDTSVCENHKPNSVEP